MSRIFTLIITVLSLSLFGQPMMEVIPAESQSFRSSVFTPTPYLRDCRSGTTDEERYRCTVNELLKVLTERFECPWRDLEDDESRLILRFMVNVDGGVERFLTLYSDNTANRPSEPFNNALIRAVYTTNGKWTPLREGGRSIPGEFVLPVSCNCSNEQRPVFQVMDTVPAYYADGHYQLQGFIHNNIAYPDGFLSRSGRQTTVLLRAMIDPNGRLDSASIRVINLNSIDYRLSENAINILLQLSRRPWRPATVGGTPIEYELQFKVIYVDDKNPKRGSIPTEWDIIIGNSHLYNDGVSQFNNREYTAAIELFKRALFLDPDDRDAWLMLGKSYIGNRSNSQARVALQRAIDLGHPDGRKWMAEAQKPDDVEPVLPAREVSTRPEQTQRLRPGSTPPTQQQRPTGTQQRPQGTPGR
jgi:tetratricopeptide (TPR) repeat protein